MVWNAVISTYKKALDKLITEYPHIMERVTPPTHNVGFMAKRYLVERDGSLNVYEAIVTYGMDDPKSAMFVNKYSVDEITKHIYALDENENGYDSKQLYELCMELKNISLCIVPTTFIHVQYLCYVLKIPFVPYLKNNTISEKSRDEYAYMIFHSDKILKQNHAHFDKMLQRVVSPYSFKIIYT